jgi:hypothetical protein
MIAPRIYGCRATPVQCAYSLLLYLGVCKTIAGGKLFYSVSDSTCASRKHSIVPKHRRITAYFARDSAAGFYSDRSCASANDTNLHVAFFDRARTDWACDVLRYVIFAGSNPNDTTLHLIYFRNDGTASVFNYPGADHSQASLGSSGERHQRQRLQGAFRHVVRPI